MVEKNIRILLVEDDPDDVWVMRNLLGDRNFKFGIFGK